MIPFEKGMGYPEGGYVHEGQHMNRARRRETWATMSSRQGRMFVRKKRREAIYAQQEYRRQQLEAMKAKQFLKGLQTIMDRRQAL